MICLAAGKGAAAMAAAAERHYLDALGLDPARLIGIATTRHGHGVPTRRIKVIEAGHPVPDEAGLKAADDTLRLAAERDARTICCWCCCPAAARRTGSRRSRASSFAQKQQVNRALLRSGAPIGEINTVRKHLSRIKGGRLARAGQPRRDRDAGDLGRAARRSLRDRLGPDGAGSDHAGGRPRAGREIRSEDRRCGPRARSTTPQTKAASPAIPPSRARNSN